VSVSVNKRRDRVHCTAVDRFHRDQSFDEDIAVVAVQISITSIASIRVGPPIAKWRDYAACCDRLHFAISKRTPADLMPVEAGLIVGDGAEIVREADCSSWPRPAAGRALSLRFAQTPPTDWPIRQ
jgi:hypothetical protein